jgi:hypothetical protein
MPYENQDEEEARVERYDKLQSILDKHEVTIVKKDQLVVLEDYNFVVICDDSESMKMSAKPKEQRKLGEKPLTRWMELQDGVTLLVDLLTVFRPEGIDVHFLNAGKVHSVKSATNDKLQSIFQGGPFGKTPLTSTLRSVAQECESELPYIMFIFTDGEPDGGSRKFCRVVEDVVAGHVNKKCSFRTQIMACSNNDEEIAWLQDLDDKSELIDVTDDYYNEKRKIVQIKGEGFSFTRSDWLIKAILGPIEKSVDMVNEGLMDKFFGSHSTKSTKKTKHANESNEEGPDGGDKGACAACTVS